MIDIAGKTYRRIAQWQSASIHAEEVAAFESCSAYHRSPRILFLSHCVPYPPDKGERIRAFRDLVRLADLGPVHLACFARSPEEEQAAAELRKYCESIYVARFDPRRALFGAGMRFAAGACLTTSYFSSASLRQHIASLKDLDVVVAYSSAMARFAPPGCPMVLDMVDVDSEKWNQYASLRWPGFVYAMEARRLRQAEVAYASRAASVIFATQHEAEIFRSFASHPRLHAMENGVDFDFFDPAAIPPEAALKPRQIVFVGVMDYFPNADGVQRFARETFPALRRNCAGLQFAIVGRNPSKGVRALESIPGVVVTGSVRDVRSYVRAAIAVVAPLRIARGIQNKVLEALAMGKRVLASPQVAATFGEIPKGLVICNSPDDYDRALNPPGAVWPVESAIREAARMRFTWSRNLDVLAQEVAVAVSSGRSHSVRV